MDNWEPGVVVRRQMLPLYIPTVSMFHNEKTRFIVNFISTVKYSERRIMKLHEEQVIAVLLCVMIIVCFVVVRYFEV